MKSLLLCSVLVCFAAQAQDLGGPSTSNLNSPSAYYNSSSPPGVVPPIGDESQLLEKSNTAPTPIPDDTSLILTPDNNPRRQSQEEDPFDLNKILESEKERDEGINQNIDIGPNSFETYPEKVR